MTLALAIHGGCGTLPKAEMTEAEWAQARSDLASALRAGWAILSKGGAAVDAVEAAVRVMEDSPHFNAGHGSAFNTEGEHELDASIMDGATLAAGAICGAKRIRNPIVAAKALMLRGDPVLLAGPAADDFAEHEGVDTVANEHFSTERRRKNLASMKLREIVGTAAEASEAEKHGTVGAVACDAEGHLAAATSTGGYTNKPVGRVGDSPIIGAGTYARDGRCAVSGTGKGEYFIRYCVGHEIASLIAYKGLSLEAATDAVLAELSEHKIGAGLVAVGADGGIVAPYNTEGMYRGWVTADGLIHVATHDHVELAGQA
ncbi:MULTISPECIES: isoaspartyl peptidase/L-asparaginase family protein [Bosea]|uniref:isoaspartyl peptidase/L-asparaginase family protein n=1 Tax=Bosea TaxID=85413 RepID=UPI0021501357|nr:MULTISPECIES: isoaspartyl peptidase/L-asparaginase [Bosea]MCR4522134.1 isoaspartyl peptidase/L-asparaginase [Bosea sp. 47.2.35]MDR6830825.1 beta-aspartyl-peptidase (threonine type) [Bosea robiniae]MDR6895482.1 beta-aspartyl-peptidase (threonine type) [Bosea sp. BE109]MDR7138878.1 beta-aspartyl-peptidase (threonine type) [Bosea sp. BE168]MDR7175579.1 beta-aspartyl-peptidase (threonine type) [Bosea sp. BE271]